VPARTPRRVGRGEKKPPPKGRCPSFTACGWFVDRVRVVGVESCVAPSCSVTPMPIPNALSPMPNAPASNDEYQCAPPDHMQRDDTADIDAPRIPHWASTPPASSNPFIPSADQRDRHFRPPSRAVQSTSEATCVWSHLRWPTPQWSAVQVTTTSSDASMCPGVRTDPNTLLRPASSTAAHSARPSKLPGPAITSGCRSRFGVQCNVPKKKGSPSTTRTPADSADRVQIDPLVGVPTFHPPCRAVIQQRGVRGQRLEQPGQYPSTYAPARATPVADTEQVRGGIDRGV